MRTEWTSKRAKWKPSKVIEEKTKYKLCAFFCCFLYIFPSNIMFLRKWKMFILYFVDFFLYLIWLHISSQFLISFSYPPIPPVTSVCSFWRIENTHENNNNGQIVDQLLMKWHERKLPSRKFLHSNIKRTANERYEK